MHSFQTRRRFLGGLTLGAAGVGLDLPAAAADTPSKHAAAAEEMPGTCVLFPQAVEGPYYFDPDLVRADITEGRPGLPLKLVLKFIDNGTCAALAATRVDVWHCDAGGIYSGYGGQGDDRNVSTKGQQYLRGTQMTDAHGIATFSTIYPGWYPGRTPHIHVKAFLNEKTLLTGQIYFPDDLSRRVYATKAPYKDRPVADRSNENDFLFQQGQKDGGGIMLAMSETDAGVTGTLLIAVDQSGGAAQRAQGLWRRLFGGG